MEKYISLLRKVLKNQLAKRNVEIRTDQDKWKYSTAYFISRVFGPFPLLILLWLVTALRSGIGFWSALWVYPLIGFVGIGMPFLVSVYMLMQRNSTDLEWSNIQDRTRILVIGLVFWVINLFLIKLLTTQTLFHLSLLAGVIVIATVLITALLKFKISIHVTAASGAFWGINFLTHFKFWWLFILILPIMWSRYVLKAHSKAQLLAGLVLSNVLIIIAVLIFGLPKIP